MTESQIVTKIIEQAESIAKAIHKGKDVEILKTSAGIVIKEISKKKIA